MAGTAPEDDAWLLVEDPGPWGRKAVAESRLPERVRDFLAALEGVRVQLVRRPAGSAVAASGGVRVLAAHLGASRPRVWSAVLDDVTEVCDLDPVALRAGAPALPAYDDPLWLVCTNGRRDRCCAEAGRPVAAALAARWPEATWETSHLGGHRFAGTLLALPAGLVLGRLGAASAVDAVAEVAAGRVPADLARGRAGLPAAAQVAELHLRGRLGLTGADEVALVAVDGGRVVLAAAGAEHVVEVRRTPGPPRRQSCAEDRLKPTWEYAVEGVTTSAPAPR